MKDFFSGEFCERSTGELAEGVLITKPENYIFTHIDTIKKRKEFFQRKQRNNLFEDITESFTFTFINKISELHYDKRFTEDEKTRIMFLGSFVSYSNKGSFLTFSNGRYIKKKNLKGLLEIKEDKKFYSFYNKLVEAKIIGEVPTETGISLKWSEEYHFRGKLPKGFGAEAGILKTYDKQIQELYQAKKENGKPLHSPKQLYTVFMILPFVHFETNTICKNPNLPLEEAEPLSIEELAKALGFSRSND